MKWVLWILFSVSFISTTAQEVADIIAQKLENETAGADDRELEDDDHDQQLEYHLRHRMNINTLDPEWLAQAIFCIH